MSGQVLHGELMGDKSIPNRKNTRAININQESWRGTWSKRSSRWLKDETGWCCTMPLDANEKHTVISSDLARVNHACASARIIKQ